MIYCTPDLLLRLVTELLKLFLWASSNFFPLDKKLFIAFHGS